MADPLIVVLAIFLLVGGTLLAFGLIAWWGQWAALRPPNIRSRRRLAQVQVLLGCFGLGFLVAALLFAGDQVALSGVAIALVVIANLISGIATLRELGDSAIDNGLLNP